MVVALPRDHKILMLFSFYISIFLYVNAMALSHRGACRHLNNMPHPLIQSVPDVVTIPLERFDTGVICWLEANQMLLFVKISEFLIKRILNLLSKK